MTRLIFYHVYAIDDWEPLVIEQLTRLMASGLYDESLSMFVNFIGGEQEVKRYRALIQGMHKVHTIKADGINTREFNALHSLWYLAQETFPFRTGIDADVLYFHTKGVGKKYHPGVPRLKENIRDWRRMMEYFVIDNWNECVRSLDAGYEAVGCNYREQDLLGAPNMGHFSGNFWWARLSYINKLPEPVREWDVAYNEFWIGMGRPKVKVMHESGIDHYLEEYQEGRYRNE